MSIQSNSRNLLKTNAIFGGVKIFQMLVSLIKNKIVAILLGPAGVGIQSLLLTTINTIYQTTNLGVPQSGVRELAINKTEDDRSKVILSINFLALFLGFISAVLCLIFSKQLSVVIFKSTDYTNCFVIVSIVLLFESILGGEIAILQGLRETKILAFSSLIGAIAALIVTVPFYYFWRLEAIPFVLVIGAAISSCTYFLFRYKKIKTTTRYRIRELKGSITSILKLGVTLMLSNSFMSILALLLNVVIRRCGTNEDVGYYQAAYACTYSFITILVSILASDYYPRLSEKNGDKQGMLGIINSQMKLFAYIVMPIVAVIVCFPRSIVGVLYSSEFTSIALPIQLMGIALIFRIIWQILSYVILAKGDRRAFLFLDAFLGNGLFFLGNIAGFYFGNLTGLAISYMVISSIVMVILFVYVKKRYNLKVSSFIVLYSIIFSIISIFIILHSIYFSSISSILLRSVYIIGTIVFCLFMLQKELDFIGEVKNKFYRYYRKNNE